MTKGYTYISHTFSCCSTCWGCLPFPHLSYINIYSNNISFLSHDFFCFNLYICIIILQYVTVITSTCINIIITQGPSSGHFSNVNITNVLIKCQQNHGNWATLPKNYALFCVMSLALQHVAVFYSKYSIYIVAKRYLSATN